MASEAAYEAAHKAKDSLLGLAADLLSWPEANIVLENGELRRSDFDQSILVAELLARTGVSVEGRADYKDPTHAHVTAFTVQVAEVSVDIETGEVNLFKMTSVHDAGKVLNPQGHDGQIFGGVVQGIGYGLVEELPMLDGRVTSTSFADYKFPNIADIPEMQAITRESEGGVGPFNIKGIGENPLSPVAPAIANAIADAVGVRIRDLPLSAEKVYSALNKLSNSP
jgi:xanthine dehydrogenase molybdenum-binding subunit